MTLFFFVVGLEARREFDLGELRDRRRLVLPFVAGIGGMIVPIAIFLAINAGGAPRGAWGAAMSTDTAFALGMLALVGARYPNSLRAFILTVAVVDDLVALIVIAIAFTSDGPRGGAGGRDHRVRPHPRPAATGACTTAVPISLLGIVAWVAFLKSGIDPIVVGPGHGAAHHRLPGGARGPGAGDRPVPRLPRAAHLRARAVRARGAALGDLAQRALAADVPPVHQLRGRAAVRAGQRRRRDQRRVSRPRLRLGDHASGSSSPTSWASRSG